ncbi:hypothetical protein ALC60_10789 [Trachymyrmex zeteki]|uniref:Uncharacterized protein n=1 Tax=Mycetomoellerius zeteki TaxID=64791 RepID=A0A151WQQ1_9HYME|nr:hypothetical protein ALC60_10789 [Trachymyrmex zeteki]
MYIHYILNCKDSVKVPITIHCVGDASRMTRNRDACRDPDESSTLLQAGLRSEGFLSPSSVLLGGSSDPLRTRRAQDADAAF